MLILVPTYGEAEVLFGDQAPRSEAPVGVQVGPQAHEAALCGFGLAAAGVLGMRAIESSGATSCLLVGIAGTYRPDDFPVGSVLEASEVRLEGIGRGRGEAFRGPAALGFDPVPASGEHPAIGDRLRLAPPATAVAGCTRGVLVSVASCSATFAEADEIRARHPDAAAEDMEAFSVALACARAGVPLRILRGVSNRVGEPDRSRWEREPALAALGTVLEALLVPSSPR